MTPAEMDQILALRTETSEGFRELRELMEIRRQEESAAHSAIYVTVNSNREATDKRLRRVEQVAYAATILGVIGMAAAVEILRNLHVSFS